MQKETFGEVIKQARKAKGVSLREMASRVGISHPYLSQLENGKNNNPSIDIILDLSRELDVSFAYLVHLSGVDIGLKKNLPEKFVNIFKILSPSDLEGWNTFDEFKKVFIDKGHIKTSDTDSIEKAEDSEARLLKLFDNLKQIKQIEQNLIGNAIVKKVLLEDEPNFVKKDSSKQISEWYAIDRYNSDEPVAIYLNPDNEGNFYFFKDGLEIPEEMQEKLRLIIKTILD